MKTKILLVGLLLIFTQCRKDEIPVTERTEKPVGIPDQEFEIALNQSVAIKSAGEKKEIGKIYFSDLDESRCPANAICIRQGAAVTTFSIITNTSEEAQSIRLFIGDFMKGDPRQKRNITTDTAALQLDNQAYRLILKHVLPYPGTSDEIPKASLVLQKQ